MTDSKLAIRVNVAERYYNLKIDRSEEARIREAAKTISEEMADMRKKFKNRDTQDHLAVIALGLAIKALELNENCNALNIETKLSEIERLMDDTLSTAES